MLVTISRGGCLHSALVLAAMLITSGIDGSSLKGHASKKVPCVKKCIAARMPPAFTIEPSHRPLKVYVTKCLILGGDECIVDFGDWIRPLEDLPTNQFYLAIGCKSHTQLKLENSRNVRRRNVVSFFQMTGPCHVSTADLSRFGVATDYRVQLFTTAATLLTRGNSSNISDIPGLRNIGTLSLQSSHVRGIPDIFTRFSWPKMAEVAFFNLSIKTVPAALRLAMPRLQTFELNNNSLTEPPDFPWDDAPLELPRNLRRTAVFNNHYQQGTIVLPNLYRRFLILEYNNIQNLSTHVFQGFLQKLSLKGNGLLVIGPQCFTNLTGVNIIDLSYNKLSMLPKGLFDGKEWMLELRLAYNNLSNLPPLAFKHMTKLQRLYLHNNRIQRIQAGLLSTNEELVELTLHSNDITYIEGDALPENSNTLQALTLNNNKLQKVPRAVFLLRNLVTADLSFNDVNFRGIMDVLDSIMIERLMYNLRESASTLASRTKLKTRTVHLNLANNNIKSIDLANMNTTQLFKVEAIFSVFEINMRNNPLSCDCKMLPLVRMLKRLINRRRHIKYERFDTWICATPRRVQGQPVLRTNERDFTCVMDLENCPKKCKCAVRSIDGRVIVDCRRKRLRKLPEKMPSGQLEIYLEHNLIEDLGWREYLGNVTILQLSYNKINNLNVTFLDSLVNTGVLGIDNNKLNRLPREIRRLTSRASFRLLSIHHNYFTCDCNALWMKAWIMNNTDKISEITSVLCASGRLKGKAIVQSSDTLFVCPQATAMTNRNTDPVPLVFAIVLAVILVLVIAIFGLVYHFRFEMKILMYTHFNWHPFDRVDDSDDSKIYDSFISYSSHDRRWVLDNLRTELEHHDPPYRLCLHDRDFEIGASIHENILNSVHNSKRMIMVLSNDFIASDWCMMEFRTAHHKVMQDKTNYLIIILFDDVDTDKLDEETKLYLRTNTYLSVSNKWFWKKLLYALPEPRGTSEKTPRRHDEKATPS